MDPFEEFNKLVDGALVNGELYCIPKEEGGDPKKDNLFDKLVRAGKVNGETERNDEDWNNFIEQVKAMLDKLVEITQVLDTKLSIVDSNSEELTEKTEKIKANAEKIVQNETSLREIDAKLEEAAELATKQDFE